MTDDVVLVAGGATGIGAATAQRLARDGFSIVVGDVNLDGAEATAALIRLAGGRAMTVRCDITSEDSVRGAVQTGVEEFGRLTGLFNVAAEMRDEFHLNDSNVVDIDLATWDQIVAVDLRGFLLTMKHAIPELLKAGGGRIVNTSSAASYIGEPLRPAYAASKAGVNALTRHVANRWGKAGIRCNAVAPGLVDTAAARRSAAGTARSGYAPEDFSSRAQSNPSGRLGTPDDIAATVAFLFGEDSGWINGQVLSVDGGVVMK